jgi:hypothetical protein
MAGRAKPVQPPRDTLYYPEKYVVCSFDDVPSLPRTDGLARAFIAIVESHLRRQEETAVAD